jgi:arylsulfatase A-like enzyme
MNRRTFLSTNAAVPVAAAAAPAPGPAAGRRTPNIVFFLFDMCRRDAIGAYDMHRVHTPNIDRLAAQGIRFNNCYTPQALCGPARASIITGLHPHAHGVDRNVYPTKGFFAYDLFHESIPNPFADPRFNLSNNFPFLLLNSGYETAQIGKWHLGPYNPGFFNTFKGFNSGLSHWVGKPQESEYRPDVQTDEALAFIERNAARRFFLYLSFYTPHSPYQPPLKYLEYFKGRNDPHADYHAAVTNLDWNVSRVVAALEKHGILDNTFIVLTTEHGKAWEPLPGTVNGYDNSYEEAAHIPLIMRFPALIPAGKVWNSGVSLVDLAPTLLEAAGVNLVPMHGRSLLRPLSSGDDRWSRPVVIENVAGKPIDGSLFRERAIRTEKWKLILRRFDLAGVQADELYDMEQDPGEKRNLFSTPAGRPVVRELCRPLIQWGEETGDGLALELGRRASRG